jgi:hypothetical protein
VAASATSLQRRAQKPGHGLILPQPLKDTERRRMFWTGPARQVPARARKTPTRECAQGEELLRRTDFAAGPALWTRTRPARGAEAGAVAPETSSRNAEPGLTQATRAQHPATWMAGTAAWLSETCLSMRASRFLAGKRHPWRNAGLRPLPRSRDHTGTTSQRRSTTSIRRFRAVWVHPQEQLGWGRFGLVHQNVRVDVERHRRP